jgi:hypothetical protein
VLDAAAELAKGLANPLAFLPAVARVFGIFGSQGPDPILAEMMKGFKGVNEHVKILREELKAAHQITLEEIRALQSGVFGLLAFLKDDQSARGDTATI